MLRWRRQQTIEKASSTAWNSGTPETRAAEMKDKLLGATTILASFFAIVVCWLLPLFPQMEVLKPLNENKQLDLLIGLLGFLGITMGIDQWISSARLKGLLQHVDGQIDLVAQLVRASTPSIFVEGFSEVFFHSIRDVRRARSFIRVTANMHTGPAPEFWAVEMRDALLRSKATGGNLGFEVKMFLDFAEVTSEVCDAFEHMIANRYEALEDRVKFTFHNSKSQHGLDIMNIDGEHIHIRFSGSPGRIKETGFALAVSESATFGSAVTRWYEGLGEGESLLNLRQRIARRRS